MPASLANPLFSEFTFKLDTAGCVDVAGSEAMEDIIFIVGGAVEGTGLVPVFSTLIGRGMSRLDSHWSGASKLSYAIKNQLLHQKPPNRGFGTQRVFACSSLVLYGIRDRG